MAIKKRAHIIKDNQTSAYPSHFIFFDTETYPIKQKNGDIIHELRLGVAVYWRHRYGRDKDDFEWCYFTSPDEFWDFLEAHAYPKERLFIIAHNLTFDMGEVKGFAQLDKRGYEVVKMIFDNRKNIWKFRKDSNSLLFLDNMNYFSMSLAALGENIGFPKLDMPPFEADNSVWWPYCKRDVEVLLQTWQHWLSFLKDNELGTFAVTIASQAFNAYRHRFMPIPIGVHTSKKAVKLERAAYRGGRVECFRIGKLPRQKYYLLDVNSMYAYMLKTYPYPIDLVGTGKALSLGYLADLLTQYTVIAEVQVDIPEPCYGIKMDNRLIFPIGKFRVTLNSIELEYGLVRGYIKEVYNFSYYEMGYCFTDYVDYFHSKRVEFHNKGNKVYSYLCKLMLNSLYGKFGQAVEEWKPIGYDAERVYDYWTEWDTREHKLYTYRCINHWCEEKVGSQEGYNSLVAIPSEATAYARLVLWQLMKKAGRDNVFYCDTDSLIVNKTGYDNLATELHPTELGKLKLEGTALKLVLYGLKDYIFGTKVVTKGIPKKAKKLSEGVYETYQSVGIRTGLHTQELNEVIWKRRVKHLYRVYKKGIVTASGKVEPIRLGNTT